MGLSQGEKAFSSAHLSFSSTQNLFSDASSWPSSIFSLWETDKATQALFGALNRKYVFDHMFFKTFSIINIEYIFQSVYRKTNITIAHISVSRSLHRQLSQRFSKILKTDFVSIWQTLGTRISQKHSWVLEKMSVENPHGPAASGFFPSDRNRATCRLKLVA